MELRKQVESLALWYIPAFIIMGLLSSVTSGLLEQLFKDGIISPSTTVPFFYAIGSFVSNIDNLVVGVWLLAQSKKENSKPILWFLFGVVAHFYAAIIYIGLKIYENQMAYNQGLQSTSLPLGD